MEDKLIEIWKTEDEEIEVYYHDGEIILFHGDLIHFFDAHNMIENVLFLKILSKRKVKEIDRARIMSRIVEESDKEIEQDRKN